MYHLFKKIAITAMLTLTISTITHANEVFSHAVLILPDDPRTEEAWTLTINSQEEWESFYNQTLASLQFLEGTAPTPPTLDFDTYQVLSGGLGRQDTGGNLLVVKEVIEDETFVTIHALLVRPNENCQLPMNISYPSATILIKKTEKPFNFLVSQLIDECL